MLEVTRGSVRSQVTTRHLVQSLQGLGLDGSLYLGYPVLATAEEPFTVDALLVTEQHGLVAFYIADSTIQGDEQVQNLKDEVDRLYVALENNLRRNDDLRSGRRLAFDIQVVALFPVEPVVAVEVEQTIIATPDSLPGKLESLPGMPIDMLRRLQAALQRVSSLRSKKRRQKATNEESRGSILRKIELEIANLDQWQKRAAIESPEGPQRIRGLAGSGKTIVLALKAAYLHAQHPDWNIAVTFQSRSLYQQFTDLIRKFSLEQNIDPDWERLQILHAWGGGGRPGIYWQIARHAGIVPQDFSYARARYGQEQAFQGVCSELLAATTDDGVEPVYDAVLIDEAQDLPVPFFRLLFRFTKPPRRIILAYDEFQKLSEATMPTMEELFGTDESGEPKLRLDSDPNADQDIVLPVCYRNPPWVLVAAHSLGLGIYREQGLVQHFDDPTLWSDIGYEFLRGLPQEGSDVELARAPSSYPEYFPTLLQPNDTVSVRAFETEADQAAWLAESIQNNLDEDQLDYDDVLVVLPSPLSARSEARTITRELAKLQIDAHLAGVTSSVDEIFLPDSIALAHIHRSKGNEAAMVYVVNAQRCLGRTQLVTMRNTIFTAITRSKAWVRICGWGPDMTLLAQELAAVSDHNYHIAYKIPTNEELSRLRQIHRERSAAERRRIAQMESQLRSFIEALESGDVDLSDLPLDVRASLARYLGQEPPPSDDHE